MVTELHVERSWPYILSVVLAAGWWIGLGRPFPADFTALMGAAGTAAAVLMGFLSTANTIVLGLTGSDVFQKLKKAGYHDILMEYLKSAIYGNAFLLIASILGFFVEPNQNANVSEYIYSVFPVVWVLFALFAVLSFLRVTSHLFKLFRWV